MYKQSWDHPSSFDHDTVSDRSSAVSGIPGSGRAPVLAEFEVDYIISFVAGEYQAAPTVGEALSKLHQLDASGGIWTIRCQLLVSGRDLVVVNRQTGEEMERFPLSLMHDVTSSESRDPKETFNNLFIFVGFEDGQAPEMHIFQSVMTPAARIADEVRRIKEGRHQAMAIESAAVRNGRGSTDMGSVNLRALSDFRQRSASGSDPGRPESPSLAQAEREVYILNRCFDDIELFVARTQNAIESYQELQRRQNQRKKKDKKLGDGLLISRSRMPVFEDFIDCFKKFKLAFNLLAHLQDFIHDPNASELVHFLFTPLIFVTKASPPPSDNAEPGDHLISHVVSPLLTRDAVLLLRHCLSSKQSEFWRSLGDAWTAPRETWKGYVPPFLPRFSDNYSPPLRDFQEALGLVAEPEDSSNGGVRTNVTRTPSLGQHPVIFRKESFERVRPKSQENSGPERPHLKPVVPKISGPRLAGPSAENSATLVETVVFPNRVASPLAPAPVALELPGHLSWEEQQLLYKADVESKGGKIVQVIASKKGDNRKELTVKKGEYLEVLEDGRNWWKMRNMASEVGHVPYTILRSPKDSTSLKDSDIAPRAHTSNIPAPPPPPPPPPAPPLIDPYSSGVAVRRKDEKKEETKRRSQQGEHVDELANELKQKITLGSKPPRVVKRPKAVNINQESTPEQVTEWLRLKGFTDRTLKMLAGRKGYQLFQMKRPEMDDLLSREEASRLDSLLTVQKNICGYGTRSSLELRAILKSRKERSESAFEFTDDI